MDAWLQREVPDHSRSRWQNLIKSGHVKLNGNDCKASQTLRPGDEVEYEIPAPQSIDLCAEDIPLDVLYEDSELLVVNKQPGLVVHPAAGHPKGTLVNALLHHCGDLKGIGGELRPGIVHRLDKDTSGIMVVAKTGQAMKNLADQFKQRSTEKEYAAIVRGIPEPPAGKIESEIGRSRHDRKRMSVSSARGRRAVTHYQTVRGFKSAAHLSLIIETGRTHQIRVHMAHIQHPVIGDKVYGGKRERQNPLPVKRQMLHASRLAFTHPRSGERIEALAPLPNDMEQVLSLLEEG